MSRCLVVHPRLKGEGGRGSGVPSGQESRLPEMRLEEATGLARAIDLEVAHARVVTVSRLRPATLFGSGVVEELAAVVASAKDEDRPIDVAIVDAQVTPVQQRNLEKAWACKVIDRTGLILEIFGQRARTREGSLQVELAALTYQRSRLVRSWTHLERQRGGFGFMGGPGETQIETDRRLIGERIAKLKKELEDVKRTRELHRQARRRVPYPVVALVGYTNAGKSTLFNTLTHAHVVARDQLFATLDPTMRGLELPSGRRVILSDTVGFISDLPHELVNAFHATLEEVQEAEIILHVRDASHPSSDEQRDDVHAVLSELGLEGERLSRSLIEVLNKMDRVSPEEREALELRAVRGDVPTLPLSARTGAGCPALLDAIDVLLARGMTVREVRLPHDAGATLAWLYQHGQVVERHDAEDHIHVTVRLDDKSAARFERLVQQEGQQEGLGKS